LLPSERPSIVHRSHNLHTRWALDLLLEEYKTLHADEIASFYRRISGMSDAASLWGQVFGWQVLNYLDGINAEHKFLIRGLTASEKMTWSYRGPIRRFNFLQDVDFNDRIRKAIKNKNSLHLVPSDLNFPVVDSILYGPNEVLTCI